MADDPLPETFHLSLEITTKGAAGEKPMVAAVGWGIDMGDPQSERDIGEAVRRVLEAANALHGHGLHPLLTLAYALDGPARVGPDNDLRNAARAYIASQTGG